MTRKPRWMRGSRGSSTIKCGNCGAKIRVNSRSSICPNCGEEYRKRARRRIRPPIPMKVRRIYNPDAPNIIVEVEEKNDTQAN